MHVRPHPTIPTHKLWFFTILFMYIICLDFFAFYYVLKDSKKLVYYNIQMGLTGKEKDFGISLVLQHTMQVSSVLLFAL